MSSPVTKPSWFTLLSVSAITVLLSGCQNYFERRDTIAFGAGEAPAYNKAVHIIDPWPRAAANADLEFDGERSQKAIARYKAYGDSPPPAAGMTINVPMPPSAPPSQ